MANNKKAQQVIKKMFDDSCSYKTLSGPFGETKKYLFVLDGTLWIDEDEAKAIAEYLGIEIKD